MVAGDQAMCQQLRYVQLNRWSMHIGMTSGQWKRSWGREQCSIFDISNQKYSQRKNNIYTNHKNKYAILILQYYPWTTFDYQSSMYVPPNTYHHQMRLNWQSYKQITKRFCSNTVIQWVLPILMGKPTKNKSNGVSCRVEYFCSRKDTSIFLSYDFCSSGYRCADLHSWIIIYLLLAMSHYRTTSRRVWTTAPILSNFRKTQIAHEKKHLPTNKQKR